MRISVASAILLAGYVFVGSGSVAAAPADNETTERVSYTDRAKGLQRDESGWVELADPTPCKHGKVFISIGRGAGTFSKLRIDASKGRPIVRTVRIDFENGRSRIVHLGKVLDKRKRPSAIIDLGGERAIDQIVVIGDRDSRGLYTVHGSSEDGEKIATR